MTFPDSDVEEIAAWHEQERNVHMMHARAYRDELERLRQTDPEEYAQWDRNATIGEQVFFARYHNRAAWLIRWHDRNRPRQTALFEEAIA